MNFLSLLLNKRSAPSLGEDRYWESLLGPETDAGVRVTAKSALGAAPVWQAINLLANKVAGLDLHLYRRLENDEREDAIEHPGYRLVRRAVSKYMSKGVFFRTMMGLLLRYGNAYAYIDRDRLGNLLQLIILDPSRTYPVAQNGDLWYVVQVGGDQRKLHANEVLHLMGLSNNGIVGMSVVQTAAQQIGLTLGVDSFAARYFSQGCRASGVLMYPGALKEDKARKLGESFDAMHEGLENSHKTILLTGGTKYVTISANPHESQLLDSRKFQIAVVASIFGIPPHKLGAEGTRSWASLIEENQSFLDDSLDPYLRIIEEECNLKLLKESEKKGDAYYFWFLRDAALRMKPQERFEIYTAAIRAGIMTRETVCKKEDLPLVAGGHLAMIPADMVLLDETGKPMHLPDPLKDTVPQSGTEATEAEETQEEAGEESEDTSERQYRLDAAHKVVLADSLARMMRRLADRARSAAKKPKTFSDDVDAFLAKDADIVASAVLPALEAIRASRPKGWPVPRPDALARSLVERCHHELLEVAGNSTVAELASNVDRLVMTWDTEMVESLANDVIGRRAA